MKKVNWFVVLTGAVVGLAAVILTAQGNPANMPAPGQHLIFQPEIGRASCRERV